MNRLVFLLFMTTLANLNCQTVGNGYDIPVTVSGLPGAKVYLAYHMGNRQYIRDSLTLGSDGRGTFSGPNSLDQGVYMLVLPGSRYFEFLITDDQSFSIRCDHNDLMNSIEFEGSAENVIFFNFQKGWAELHSKSEYLRSRYSLSRQNPDSLEVFNNKMKGLDAEMKAYLNETVDKNRGSYVAALVKAMVPIDLPDFASQPELAGNDSLQWVNRHNYTRDHYFDNFDLSDDRLLRSPMFHNKIEHYFTEIILQYPDSVMSAIDKVIGMTGDNKKTFQYVSVFLFNHFRESQLMGHDAIIVKLADDIYLSGRADWATPEFVDNLRKDVDKLRPSLIGNKAVNLVMETYGHGPVSLQNINSEFLILYFWEPDCGHCKETTPLLREFYLINREKGIEVLSICTQPDRKKWEDYIRENELNWINGWDPDRLTHYDFFYNIQATPTIFILDREKRIIAKKLPIESVEPFIENYRKYGR
ncbi:MAG: thioredoxin-like domain-containing protein [Bacteroidales bacterium]|nr:thioredoxin-like domain-containing protein [Bacteroidales bacterium]